MARDVPSRVSVKGGEGTERLVINVCFIQVSLFCLYDAFNRRKSHVGMVWGTATCTQSPEERRVRLGRVVRRRYARARGEEHVERV